MNSGYLPRTPVTIVTENGDDAAAGMAMDAANKAQATADNARQMARNIIDNNGPRITTLEDLAADYQARVAESVTDRQALHATQAAHAEALDSLAADLHDEAENRASADTAHQIALSQLRADLTNITLTPGTAGANGLDGKSAYELARDNGYGGTLTQWLATLKGADGKDGAPGKDGTALTIATGTGRLTAALILGGTVDVTVNLSRNMGNTTYSVGVAPTSGFTFGTPKNKTQTSVTIPVTAALALAIGASFQLIAWT